MWLHSSDIQFGLGLGSLWTFLTQPLSSNPHILQWKQAKFNVQMSTYCNFVCNFISQSFGWAVIGISWCFGVEWTTGTASSFSLLRVLIHRPQRFVDLPHRKTDEQLNLTIGWSLWAASMQSVVMWSSGWQNWKCSCQYAQVELFVFTGDAI